MKKTALQISSFLSQHSFKSDQDLNRILAICQSEGGLPSHSSYTIDTENGITVIDYLHWNDNCVGAGDICRMGDDLVICGICRLACATIVGKLSDDEILILDSETPQTALKLASDEERYDFMCIMLENRLQFSLKEMKLVEKYVPQPGERVIFTSPTVSGLGVVKTVHFDTDRVDYFCYYINETEQVGYSMDEKSVTGLSDVIFEPMNNSSLRQTSGNGIYLQRKLNNILSKYGKTWNEKLHRIEPLEPMSEKGKPYWYINDKLELVQDEENGKMSSRFRYRCANYFKTHAEGLEYLGRVAELLRDRLAIPDENYPKPE